MRIRFKQLLSLALVCIMALSCAAMPAFARHQETTYEPVELNLTHQEMLEQSGKYYVHVYGDVYEPLTVTKSVRVDKSYLGEDGKTYDEKDISTRWTASNGKTFEAASPFVTASLKTYTRTSRRVLLTNYYRYVNDKNSSDKTKEGTTARKARENFKAAKEFHDDGATNKSPAADNPFYVAAVYTAVKLVETPVDVYTYSCMDYSESYDEDGLSHSMTLFEKVTRWVEDPEDPAEDGTFTVASMNVDGLPNKLVGITLNGDGPGAEGTKKISKAIAKRGWDFFAVSEDFNYNTELMSALNNNYNAGTHRGKISWLTNNTDGLNLIWKNSLQVTGEKWTKWNKNYSTGIFNTGNGADGMINKGFRYYAVTVAEGVTVDVYILHMDADSDQGDIDARESQLRQLVAAIKASNNHNPIIVMGDTNCRYTRERLQELFHDSLNADPRFEVSDPWVDLAWEGVFPTYGADSIMAQDKGGPYPYPQAEIVDKLFVINNTDSLVRLEARSYTVDESFVGADGTPLADHWPIVVKIAYTVEKPMEEVLPTLNAPVMEAMEEETEEVEVEEPAEETLPEEIAAAEETEEIAEAEEIAVIEEPTEETEEIEESPVEEVVEEQTEE